MYPTDLLDYWTKRRHAIIHQGKNESVWSEEAAACCDLVGVLGDHVDDIATSL